MSKELEKFSKYSNKYLGYNRISEDIAIAALKSDTHYRNIAKLMNEDRASFNVIGYLIKIKLATDSYTLNPGSTPISFS